MASNFPTQLPNINVAGQGGGGMQFPSDLIDNQKSIYMSFSFYKYDRGGILGNLGGLIDNFTNGKNNALGNLLFQGGETVLLPMPNKINDHPTVDWQQDNLFDATSIPGMGIANKYMGYFEGATINPFLVMLFKSPKFKEFHFSWTLAPRTQDETNTLNDILKTFRKNMLPDKGRGAMGVTLTLDYPMICHPKFFPSDKLFQFKPCAIRGVHFDYNPAGNPAFFKDTGGPASVKLTVDMVEIEYWLKSEIQ